MKNLTLLVLAALTCCLAMTDTAQAQRPDRKRARQRLLERFDRNKDGKLDEQERKAARAARKKAREERARKRGDGPRGRRGERPRGRRGDRPRGRGGKEARSDRRARLLKRFDENGDGKLDEQERRALREALKERRGGRGDAGPDRARRRGPDAGIRRRVLLRLYDRNRSGHLERREMRLLVRDGRSLMQRGPQRGRRLN